MAGLRAVEREGENIQEEGVSLAEGEESTCSEAWLIGCGLKLRRLAGKMVFFELSTRKIQRFYIRSCSLRAWQLCY